jgi:hypothetical protein
MTFGSKVIEPHHMLASLCTNGAVFIRCNLHNIQGFINHPKILEAIHAENGQAKVPATATTRDLV